MSSNNLWFNMVAGAVLATGLGIMGLRTVGEMVYANDHEAIGYPVTVAEATEVAGPAVAELAPDWGTLLADPAQVATLVAAGEGQAKVCASCHAFEAGGANKTGPALYGVMGRTAGTHAGFAYSDAMKAHAKPWDFDELYSFLKAPKVHVKGTAMAYAGMAKSPDRVALVTYLRSLAPNPAAVPAPDPARNLATAAGAPAPAAPVEGAATAAAAVDGATAAGANAVAGDPAVAPTAEAPVVAPVAAPK